MNHEQTKNLAVFYNNLATAFVIVGTITPFLINQAISLKTYIGALVSLFCGIILLLISIRILRDVKW